MVAWTASFECRFPLGDGGGLVTGERMILTRRARSAYERWSVNLGKVCAAMRLSPNMLTGFSVLAAGCATFLFAAGHFYWGLLAALASCAFDVLDGATARATATESPAGTVMDRAADRTSEALFFLGFLLSGRVEAWMAFLGFFGLVAPSYVRAVAESVGGVADCEVGLAGRLEKLLVVFAGAGLDPLLPGFRPLQWAILVAGALSLVTAVQRLIYTARREERQEDWQR